VSTECEQIGACTLYRGDCLTILPTLEPVGQVLTSPPFNAGRAYERRAWTSLEAFFQFTRTWVASVAQLLRPGGWCFVEVQDMHLSPEHPHATRGQTEQVCMNTHAVISQAMSEAGLLFKETVIWHRGRWGGNASRLICAPGSPAVLTQHSHCLFARQPGGRPGAYAYPELSPQAKALWCRSVWDHIQPEAVPGHPCPMPLVMARGVMQGWSLPPDTILDPFMGSGTAGVAAVELGRAFIGIEQEPEYFDLACQRIEQAQAQPSLFACAPAKHPRQEVLFARNGKGIASCLWRDAREEVG
jgi:DNA modification methylase